jgi:hypothetical protein
MEMGSVNLTLFILIKWQYYLIKILTQMIQI